MIACTPSTSRSRVGFFKTCCLRWALKCDNIMMQRQRVNILTLIKYYEMAAKSLPKAKRCGLSVANLSTENLPNQSNHQYGCKPVRSALATWTVISTRLVGRGWRG